MFVTIRHGDGEQVLFNPDCRVHVFNVWIRKLTGIPFNSQMDLCDEKGELKHVSGKDEYVSKFLEDRQFYIPVTIRKKDNGRMEQIIPSLVSPEVYYPKLLMQLEDEIKMEGRSRDRFKKLTKRSTQTIGVSRSQHTRPRGKKT